MYFFMIYNGCGNAEKKKAKKDKSGSDASAAGEDYMIQPSSVTPVLDTSKWPLLLKNYNALHVRSSHYTPIPSGSSPLKRTLNEYVR
jgi:H/ACA ribonucleoprotein complex subunit 4